MRNIRQNVGGAEALSKVSDLKINKVELMPDGNTLRVLVKKEGSDSINEPYSLRMVVTGADGKTQTLELDASLKPLESKYYSLETQNGLKKIEIYPIVSTTSGQKVGRATDVYTPSSGGLASLPKNPNCVKSFNTLTRQCSNFTNSSICGSKSGCSWVENGDCDPGNEGYDDCSDKDSCEREFGCSFEGNSYWNSYVDCYPADWNSWGKCYGDNSYSCSDYSDQGSCENEGPCYWDNECKNYPCDMWDWDEGTCWTAGCYYDYCWNYVDSVENCQNAMGGGRCDGYLNEWCDFYNPNYGGYWTGWERCGDYDSCNREWGCGGTWIDLSTCSGTWQETITNWTCTN